MSILIYKFTPYKNLAPDHSEGIDHLSQAAAPEVVAQSVSISRRQAEDVLVGNFIPTLEMMRAMELPQRLITKRDVDRSKDMQYLNEAFKKGRVIIVHDPNSSDPGATIKAKVIAVLPPLPGKNMPKIKVEYLLGGSDEVSGEFKNVDALSVVAYNLGGNELADFTKKDGSQSTVPVKPLTDPGSEVVLDTNDTKITPEEAVLQNSPIPFEQVFTPGNRPVKNRHLPSEPKTPFGKIINQPGKAA